MDTCERNDSIPLIITNNVCDNKWALYMANKLCRGLAIYVWNNAELLLHTVSAIILLYFESSILIGYISILKIKNIETIETRAKTVVDIQI